MDDTLLPSTQNDIKALHNSITLKAKPDAPLHILFVGDTSFGENYQDQIKQQGGENILETKGYSYSLRKVKDILIQSDLVIANLETSLTDLKVSPLAGKKKYLHWSDPIQASEHLFKNNIRVVNLANNHMLDYGREGLANTFESLNKAGIHYFGAGNTLIDSEKPYLIHITDGKNNFHIAIIGAYEEDEYYRDKFDFYASKNKSGVQMLTIERLFMTIQAIKEQYPTAIIVASPHWGNNYEWKTKQQHNIAKQLNKIGVDIIIGHGAHRLQEIDIVDGHWVINSLGNFVFNSPGRYAKLNAPPYSLMLKLICTIKQGILDIQLRLYPIVTDNKKTNYQTRLTTDTEFKEVIQLLNQSSGKESSSYFTQGSDTVGSFIEFPFTVKNTALSNFPPQLYNFPYIQSNNLTDSTASRHQQDSPIVLPLTDTPRYIGLLCYVRMEHDVTNKFIPWVHRSWIMNTIFKQHNLTLFIYSPQMVDIHTKKSAGYLIKNGQYIIKLMDIPRVNYDWSLKHVPEGMSTREYHAWAEEANIKLFPTHDVSLLANDKYKTYQTIQTIDNHIQPYSELFEGTKTQVKSFFSKNDILLLKPRHGRQGRGILFIETGIGERGKPYYLLNWYLGEERREIVFESLTDTMERLENIIKNTSYVIQMGVHSLRHQGAAFHIRVVMVYDGKEWQWVHEIRCGSHYSAVSTYPFLGSSYSLINFLSAYFDNASLTAFLNKLKTTSLKIVTGLDTLYHGRIGELALDFVVDNHYHFYLVEINTKPGVVGDPNSLPDFFEAKHYPAQTELYFHYLAQFFNQQWELEHN